MVSLNKLLLQDTPLSPNKSRTRTERRPNKRRTETGRLPDKMRETCARFEDECRLASVAAGDSSLFKVAAAWLIISHDQTEYNAQRSCSLHTACQPGAPISANA
jgi:hypothetical protein